MAALSPVQSACSDVRGVGTPRFPKAHPQTLAFPEVSLYKESCPALLTANNSVGHWATDGHLWSGTSLKVDYGIFAGRI